MRDEPPVQAHLQSGTTHVRALFQGPAFKVGDRVTLVGDDRVWAVLEVGRPVPFCFRHRDWRNNI